MLLSKAQGKQTFKLLNQAICRALCTEWCEVPWMDHQYSWFNLRIATISTKRMLNHTFPKGSHLKSPIFFGDSIHLAGPTFLCREALQLALWSFQTGLRQPGPPQDHKRCWRTVTEFLKFPANDSHVSISYLYIMVLRLHLANSSAWPDFFQLSVVSPINKGPRKIFLNITMVGKVFFNCQQGSWTCRDHFVLG